MEEKERERTVRNTIHSMQREGQPACSSAASAPPSELCWGAGVSGLRLVTLLRQENRKAAGKPFWTITNNKECPGVGEGIQLCTPSTISPRKPRAEAFKSENEQNKHVHIVQLPGDSTGNRRQVNGTLKISSKSFLELALGLLLTSAVGWAEDSAPRGHLTVRAAALGCHSLAGRCWGWSQRCCWTPQYPKGSPNNEE